ncbi:MAG: spore germination protein [Clostridia bacterium]|nr:spore germination protein [Clostridia bacterium]
MSGSVTDYSNVYLSKDLDKNVALLKGILSRDAILRVREVYVGGSNIRCVLFYMDGMVNSHQIGETVVQSIVKCNAASDAQITPDYIEKNILFADDVGQKQTVSDILRAILYGDTVILTQNSTTALVVNTKGWKTRGISEPEGERVLQGPREGFAESAMTNVSLLRRKLVTPDLCVEMLNIGRRTDTKVFVCYLGTLADSKTVNNLKKQLKKIDIDGILDSNYIAESIRGSRLGVLKTIGSTERPDVVAARLLEGRIAVIVDGTPAVLTLPYLFSENFQSDEDYYINFWVASLGRALRWLSFFISVSVPGVFVALTTHHFELLPTHFALTVSRLREGVPIATVAECMALIFAFEILKEAGLRSPENLGHALNVVGALVVGQAAVEAGIISAPMLIAVAFSAIAGLMVPRLSAAVFYLRIINVIVCAAFGLYGYFIVSSLFVLRVFSIKSFGVDYTTSFAKPDFWHLKDSFIRAGWNFMKTRPDFNFNLIRRRDKK